ncbi:hypothetical protein B0O80DRAFT_432891 [Mortierella sp. GBAus27b]|nr:ubiquitin-binding protein cue5 [Mortierella sp. GBA43]KAI8363167.1 hypothetical protein B0O80DRAFT_432891 [Mortierella sp. GBAus27b]
MSSTNNDSKPTENSPSSASDINVDATSTTTPGAAAVSLSAPTDDTAVRKPGSPQAPIDNPFGDHNDSSAVHTASETIAPTTVATPPASTSPAATTEPTPAPTSAPTTPASEREAKLAILTEAFPTVEKEVCEFVLESHRGNVEASINALLEISDPEFRPEPPQQAPPTATAPTSVPPALPARQNPDTLAQGVTNMDLGQNHPQTEIDPILLASTSTSEQQLRSDEDFARTLAAMDEYRARERQNLQQGQQQQGQDGPSFTQELKELVDEELPKIKERFNVAADTTKKKVTGWYNQIKTKAEAAAAARNQAQANQAQATRANQGDNYGNQDGRWSNEAREPIQFGTRIEDDEPLGKD